LSRLNFYTNFKFKNMADIQQNSDGGGSATTILVAVIIVLIVGAALYFGFLRGGAPAQDSAGLDLNVTVPTGSGQGGGAAE
jgi:flagellar basal body-associated protein FliL